MICDSTLQKGDTLKFPYHAHFQVYAFITGAYWKMFTCIKVEKYHHTGHYCSNSIHLLSVLAPVSLDPPSRQVCSDLSAVTGLNRHRPVIFHISSASVFATTAVLGSMLC